MTDTGNGPDGFRWGDAGEASMAFRPACLSGDVRDAGIQAGKEAARRTGRGSSRRLPRLSEYQLLYLRTHFDGDNASEVARNMSELFRLNLDGKDLCRYMRFAGYARTANDMGWDEYVFLKEALLRGGPLDARRAYMLYREAYGDGVVCFQTFVKRLEEMGLKRHLKRRGAGGNGPR
jgi:hypothetical protein